MVCEEGLHNFHFIEIDGVNENYVENDVCKIKVREKRFSTFICDKCGLLKKVEVFIPVEVIK